MNLGNHWLDSVDNLANNRQPRLNDPILDVEETPADHSRPIERKGGELSKRFELNAVLSRDSALETE